VTAPASTSKSSAKGTEDDVRYFIDADALLRLWDELVLPTHVRRAWASWFERHRALDLAC
jgi:hypothetical protein